jgi:Domain of unknown function (DUF4394)
MINNSGRRKLLAASAAALIALLVAASPARADDLSGLGDAFFKRLKVIGLTDDGRLVRFIARSPRKTRNIGFVSGLRSPDSSLVGIDFRVQDGQLYGVGDGGGIYTVDTRTAQAILVSQLTVPLNGVFFGVDFNPAADRLRIISDAGQNLAHNVNAGGTTAANTALNYPAPININPATGVTGAAYTNNDLDANTGTTLFDIDTSLNQVAIQSPPAAGSLVASGKLTVDPDSWAGFDIYSRLGGGVTVDNHAFASLLVKGIYGFYRIEPLTGKATFLGKFDEPVVDIAIPLNQ